VSKRRSRGCGRHHPAGPAAGTHASSAAASGHDSWKVAPACARERPSAGRGRAGPRIPPARIAARARGPPSCRLPPGPRAR